MSSKLCKIIFIAIILAFAGFIAVSFFTVKEAEYSEKDTLAWYLMTPSIIAKAPKISQEYIFSYTPDDNYGFEVNAIHFRSVENVEQKRLLLEKYANSKRKQLDSRTNELRVNYSDGERDELSLVLIRYTSPQK